MKQADLLNSSKNWTEDFEHENGNYMNKCSSCKHQFLGHKRRFICKQCAEQQVVGELIEGEHPDEIYPRAASWLAERRNWAAQVKMLEEQLKANNSLEELEKHINGLKSYTKAYTTENGIEWVRKDSILNKIQELKTKQ